MTEAQLAGLDVQARAQREQLLSDPRAHGNAIGDGVTQQGIQAQGNRRVLADMVRVARNCFAKRL